MGPPWKFVGYVERELDEGRPGRKLWSFEHGAFDAADSWDFTYGATAKWKQDWWTARAGVFQLSQIPGGGVINGDLRGGERTRSA